MSLQEILQTFSIIVTGFIGLGSLLIVGAISYVQWLNLKQKDLQAANARISELENAIRVHSKQREKDIETFVDTTKTLFKEQLQLMKDNSVLYREVCRKQDRPLTEQENEERLKELFETFKDWKGETPGLKT